MIGNKKNLTHKFKVHYEVTDYGRTVTATVTPTISPLTSKPSFCGVATYKGSGGFCIDTGKAIARKKAVRRYFKWLYSQASVSTLRKSNPSRVRYYCSTWWGSVGCSS